MSFSKRKRWVFREANDARVDALSDALGLSASIAQVLVHRGFGAEEAADDFLNPRLAGLSDPFLLSDMELAVERTWRAIDEQEHITVFGDYDVDGVTSTALLVRVLSLLGARVDSFVPDRLEEGYGLSADAVERCLDEHGSGLIITVDCGTNSVTSVALAAERGVDVIVTDHHEPADAVASALALINPKLARGDDILAGVGVAFKFAHALVKTGRETGKERAGQLDLRTMLDLVALGTVADIVPLEGENRVFVRYGLVQMESTCWAGMTALKEVASIRGELDTGHLGFQLGPRINAAGRIGEPARAVRLLTTDDVLEARNIAKLLDRNNRERRAIEQKMAEEAFEEIDRYFNPEKHFGLVVAHEGWHPGVVGIVASRVSRHYNRPSIIMGIEEDGSARGSCRSIEDFDMLAGLQVSEELLNKFGGHRMAAGLEVKEGCLEAFRDAFNAEAARVLCALDLAPVQEVDCVVELPDLGWSFFESLKKLRPFGQSNREPVWALLNVHVVGTPHPIGQKHLKFQVGSEEFSFEAIAFNYSIDFLPAGAIDVAFTLEENIWQGNSSLQLNVKDIRPAGRC